MSKRNYGFIVEVGNLGKKVTHIPKNQLLLANQGERGFKGEFHGYIGGAGVTCITTKLALTIILKLVMQWSSGQRPLFHIF